MTLLNNISFFLLVLWLCCSCSGTKHIQAGKPLLKSNDFSFKSDEKIPNKSYLEYELSTICKQKPNNKFLGIPRQRLYQAGKDSTILFNKIYRKLGEVPILFDSILMAKSAQEMRYYLEDKGYYEADVKAKVDTSRNKKRASVIYEILPKRLYRVDTTVFISRDSVIQQFIQPIAAKTLLKKGQPVSLELYNAEVSRITAYLRNNGFNFFRRNYVSQLQGDSSNFKVNLRLEIFPPSTGGTHQQYKIGKVFVQPDFNPLTLLTLKDSLIEGIHFLLDKKINSLYPDILLNKITITAGQLYNHEEENQTYTNLGALSSIKFISMKQEIDPDQPNIINYRILLTPNKRYDFTADLEGSYSNRDIVNKINLIGTAVNFSLKTRRSPLKGGALLTNSIQAGIEFDVKSLDIFTVDLGFQNQLNIPRFVDYFGLWRTISRSKKRPDGLYRFLEEQVNTRITGNVNYLQLRTLYTYLLLNAAFGYDMELFDRDRLVINHVGIDYLSPTIQSPFRVVLDNNPFLQRSFGPQLFTGFLLRDFNYFYNKKNRSSETYSVRFGFELSGLEVTALNSIYNGLSLNPTTFKIGEIDFARYAKIEIDARYVKNYTPNKALAARFNIGIVSPYGQASGVPYVKQFFIGGANSIRAFRTRQVGPGSYCSPDVFFDICEDPDIAPLENLTAYYQTGDMKLEFNLEYRFLLGKLGGYEQEGAFFLDVGNVWTLKDDTERPNSQFRFTPDPKQAINNAFYNQLAIGTGFGIRLDFSFFLLRLDWGYPLRTPYNVATPWVQDFKWRDVNWNLAIDYPF